MYCAYIDIGTSKFDIADYLDSNKMIAEYLNGTLAEGDDSDVNTATGHVAKSIGMTKITPEIACRDFTHINAVLKRFLKTLSDNTKLT